MRFPLALLVVALLVAAACGGGGQDDDARLANLMRGVVVAALAGDTGEVESFAGALPEGLPQKPPLYPGATLIGSTRRVGPPTDATAEANQLALYFIALDTKASRDDVFAYYEKALDETPWQLEASASVHDADRLDFSNANDPDISGIVQIVPGEDGGSTSIFISIQDAGVQLAETVTTTPEPALPEPVPLLGRFPEDVPTPPDAVVTSTAYQHATTTESFLLILLTEDSPEDIVAFYKDAFEKLGWAANTVTPVANEQRLDFSNADGTLNGELIIERSQDDPRLTEIDVRVRLLDTTADAVTPMPTAE